jgi:hypothetical protein
MGLNASSVPRVPEQMPMIAGMAQTNHGLAGWRPSNTGRGLMEGIDRRFVLGALAALPASQISRAKAQSMPVTAVDIALEPDATMIQHAKADNARPLKEFPKGFALDATHHPHVTLLQQFVRTADLDKVCAAADAVLEKENRQRAEYPPRPGLSQAQGWAAQEVGVVDAYADSRL